MFFEFTLFYVNDWKKIIQIYRYYAYNGYIIVYTTTYEYE